MRIFWWAAIFMLILTCSVAYQGLIQPIRSVGPSTLSERNRFEPKPDLPDRKEFGRLDGERVHGLEGSFKDGQHMAKPVSGGIYDPGHNINQLKLLEGGLGLSSSDFLVFSSAPTSLAPDQAPDIEKEAHFEDATGTVSAEHSAPNVEKQNLSYLAYYAYSEVPPETKPADTVLEYLQGIRPGTALDEIKRVSKVLGLDFNFMKTVARIESGFDPKQRTGSYVGLFQLSKNEFKKYGEGDILAPRDNAVAAALKFMTEAALFEMITHSKPTLNDVYLIHQQGVQGAAEHVSHPHRLAWRSMCATEEGKQKGERWCKRAIWGNTLPAFKRIWKNVDNVTSADFVGMWQHRVSNFYARYSEAAADSQASAR